MVTRLEGLINGESVILAGKIGDVWECTFPSVEGCELIIELKAYDEAGNYCYSARYILLFDPDSLELRLIPLTDWLEKKPEVCGLNARIRAIVFWQAVGMRPCWSAYIRVTIGWSI